MTTRAWAHAIVRRYPKAWRERYEAEVRGLIDDASIHFRDLGELLRGLFTERARELLTSDENPRRTATIIWLATPVAGAPFVTGAWLAGYSLRGLTASWPEPAQYAGLAVFCLIGVAGLAIAIRGSMRRHPVHPLILPPDVAMVLLPLLFVWAGLFSMFVGSEPSAPSALIPPWLMRSWQWVWLAILAGNLLSSLFPGHELLQTFAKLSFTEAQIRSNEQWVAGCREMISKGVPSPLNDALAQVGKWTVERDSARARLKDLGYEARFRGSVDRRESGRETAT